MKFRNVQIKIIGFQIGNNLIPRTRSLATSLHYSSIYILLSELTSAQQLAGADLMHLKNLLGTSSHGKFGRAKAVELRDAAKKLIRLIFALEKSQKAYKSVA